MWRIRIHATYKTGMERINMFEICEEFVRILLHTLRRIRANNSHVWKIRSVNINKVQQDFISRNYVVWPIFVLMKLRSMAHLRSYECFHCSSRNSFFILLAANGRQYWYHWRHWLYQWMVPTVSALTSNCAIGRTPNVHSISGCFSCFSVGLLQKCHSINTIWVSAEYSFVLLKVTTNPNPNPNLRTNGSGTGKKIHMDYY